MTTPISSLGSDIGRQLPAPLNLAGTSTPLANQVAGHQNVRADASGSLVIKPSLAKEIALYQMLQSAPRTSKLARLKPFVPQYFGTLRLEGRMDDNGALQRDVEAEVPESVVLENLSYAFTHPNIMDAKLGTVLYEPSANAEKRAKMEKQANSTTTATTGLRLTGCQAWHVPTQTNMLTPKSFGKGITVEQLPSGMVRFFPAPTDRIESLVLPPTPPPTASGMGGLPSDDPAAKTPLPLPPAEPATVQVIKSSSEEYTKHAIPPATMVRVLDLIDKELSDLETVLNTLEMRFVGSSVLIVYEGDPARLEDALSNWEAKLIARDPLAPVAEEDEDEDDEEEETDDESDDLDGTKEDAKLAKQCPPVTVKMIDFAHTWIAEGEGVDHGVLKGLGTLRNLVQGRKKELQAAG